LDKSDWKQAKIETLKNFETCIAKLFFLSLTTAARVACTDNVAQPYRTEDKDQYEPKPCLSKTLSPFHQNHRKKTHNGVL
jgi:hypothetical protein